MATIAPKRFIPYRLLATNADDWLVPKLAYEADTELSQPNAAIRRVIVSLHGTGGDAMAYYNNGKAVVATRNAAAPGVADETFVIAPQFFKQDEVNNPIDVDLLYWSGGRASGNLSGNEAENPRSYRIRSFDVMDALITHLCSPDLFPNLKIIVLVGQSNGGRFLARYAAASTVEDRIARPRGVHIRYVVMGSGSYLYMDENRLTFTNESYREAAHNDNWRNAITPLTDFSTVCSENAADANTWPWGLDDLWNYPAQVGKTQIKDQFGERDVIYLVGEEDLSESFTACPERVQGPDTLAKTLLYYRHLEQVYGAALQHRVRVVAGIGHWGLGTMNSPEGIEEIFRARPINKLEGMMIDYSDLTTVYGQVSRLQIERVGPRAQLRCNLHSDSAADHTAFFTYLDGDDAPIVSKQFDLLNEAFIHRLRVRLLYNASEGENWKRFYDLRVYRDG